MWHLIVPGKSLAPLHARGVQGGHEFVDVVHDRTWTCFAGGAEVRLRAEMALHLTAHEPPAPRDANGSDQGGPRSRARHRKASRQQPQCAVASLAEQGRERQSRNPSSR
jgi:hypothetical protein